MLAASPHQKYTLHENRDLVCFIHMESPVDRTVSGTQEPITGGVLAGVNQLSRMSEGDANFQHLPIFWGFPGSAMVKNLPANAGDTGDTGSIPGLGRSPGVRNGNPLQCSCLGKFNGQRSLVGYSPWGHKESDMTEVTEHVCYHNYYHNTLIN